MAESHQLMPIAR